MKTSLRDIVGAVRHGQAALVGEIAGYLVLLAADAAMVSPCFVDADALSLDAEGAVLVTGRPVSAEESEQSLRQLLGGLLPLLRSAAPNLERVAERQEMRGLDTLVIELEAALVPVNRRAARRSLSRLHRETLRALQAGMAVPATAPAVSAPITVAPVAPVVVHEAPRRSSLPPPLPVKPRATASSEPVRVAPLPRQLELTLTPPLPPAQTPAPGAAEPPVSSAVARAMLGALGADSRAELSPSPVSAVWVEEEDVLTEMWSGLRVLEEQQRTVLDAPVVAVASLDGSPRPLAVATPTPARLSTFPLAAPPEPESFAPDVPLFEDVVPQAERRPSDVGDLLARMKIGPSLEGDVRRGLLGLSAPEELAPRRAVGGD